MKAAILLPTRFDVALLYKAKELIRLLPQALSLSGGVDEIAVGLPLVDEAIWRKCEAYLLADSECKTVVRRLRWEHVVSENVRRMFMIHQLPTDLSGIETVCVPRDWGWNFADCDIWINFADPAEGALLPLKPTAHYVSALAERVVPAAFAPGIHDIFWHRQLDAFRMWRRAGVLLCSDETTATDLVGFAGVRKDKIIQVPSLARGETPLSSPPFSRDIDNVVWLVEPDARHAPAEFIAGLSLYWQEGGSIAPVLASQNSAAFAEDAPTACLSRLSVTERKLLSDLPTYQYADLATLSRLLARSGTLWSSEIAGGEGFALTMAQRHGMHFVGQRFPLHAELGASNINDVTLYNAVDPSVIADTLHTIEERGFAAPTKWRPAETDFDRLQSYGFVIDRLQEWVNA
jgi:hypothetical protein